MRELVKNMENLSEIKGFIIYRPDVAKQTDELAESDKALMNENELEMLKKFEGKVV